MDEVESLSVEIAEALTADATVVTGNQRAARTLRQAFDRRNRRLGLSIWQPANILAWDAWTIRLWQRLLIDGHTSHLLMNATQEFALWRQILEADTDLQSLQSKDSLSALASDAWDKLCSYNGEASLRSSGGYDTRAFQRWLSVFQARCRTDRLLSQRSLSGALQAFIEDGSLQPEASRIVLVGFDSMTPTQARLIEALRSTRCQVDEVQSTVSMRETTLVNADNEQQELFSAAQWARKFIEENPEARVAVIIPDLAKQRAEMDRVFREVLAPEAQNISASDDALPYEFSLGVPLAETQMVITAVDLLQWSVKPLPIDRVSGLLLSPHFIASSQEQGVRAEFDAFEMRRKTLLRPVISIDWLSAQVDKSARKPAMRRLSEVLREIRLTSATHLEGSNRRTHSEWAARMQELLRAARWGVSSAQSSYEFQILHKWESALDDLATLDFDGGLVSFSLAFESFKRILRQTMFAPRSREAPVQVMGPLETAGSTFDAIWFLRAGNLSWPAPIRINPLLSWQLQRKLAVPGTDVALDNEFARKVAKRISQSAQTVIFSYALQSTEGHQRPSAALADLHLSEVSIEQLNLTIPHHPVVTLEVIKDGDMIPSPPDRSIHGGAKILQLQAACGFRAFAEQRLWSTELESVNSGMDAKDTGTLVHRALEYFWQEVKTQGALIRMSTMERTALLDHCITRSLQSFLQISETPWDKAYIATQHERLRNLLNAWLDLERQRPPFEVKLSEKSLDDIFIGPLRLNLRMDRVDKIDGGELLIDYKTGSASPKDWLTERPDAPQLPLYAVLSDREQLCGVAFGLVRAGEGLDLIGYGATESILPHQISLRTSSFEAQVEDWQRVLINLAEQFHSGDARVAPKNYPKTCTHCAQRILCRLDTSLFEDSLASTEVDHG